MKKTLSEDDQKLLLFSIVIFPDCIPKVYELLSVKPDFLNWDNDLAFEANKKEGEESKSFKNEFENALKSEDFDEELGTMSV